MSREYKVDAFSQSLAALKQRGCSLLITGSVRDGTHLRVSRRLMGEGDITRRRLVVITDGNGRGDRRPDGPVDEDTYRVIDRRPAMRSVTSCMCAAQSSLDMSALERDTIEAIDDFDDAAGGLDSAELRVCIDSLRPLVDRHGLAGVEPFLTTVTERIHETSGMGHVHFPIDLDCVTVSRLSPLFDVIIEIRPGEHRWHLLEDDILTEWLAV
jgi:hypothetical protein